jgi:hypothetical protein
MQDSLLLLVDLLPYYSPEAQPYYRSLPKPFDLLSAFLLLE